MAKKKKKPFVPCELVLRVAANVVRIRKKEKGLTQEQLSEFSGLSIAYVSLIERAGRTAPLNTLEKLAGALGVDGMELLRPLEKSVKRPQ